MTDDLTRIRSRIDDADGRILDAVNERLALVRELWELKERTGADRLDPDREREIRAALHAANAGPLSEGGLDELVDAILALTKREQQRGG